MSVDRKLQTATVSDELIDYITRKIVKAVKPRKIVLFGSHARGQENEESDLDLFIVYSGTQPTVTVRRQIDNLLSGRLFPVDIIVRKPEEVAWNVKAKNSFYTEDILKKGKVLYEQNA